MQRSILSVACATLLTLFSSTLTASAGQDEATLIKQGEALISSGDFQSAINTLNSVVKNNPQSGLAYLRLGGAYLMNRNYAASIDAFQAAIGIDPNNATAFAALGMSYMHIGRYGPAKAALDQAVLLDASKADDVAPLLKRLEDRLANGAGAPAMAH